MKTITLALAITLAIGIGTGCSKTEPTAAPAADTNAAWAPEIAEKPAVHDADDGKDHSGHDH